MGGKSAVGRTGALRLYKYPERQGSGALTGPFARNFAAGPASDVVIPTTGLIVPWSVIYSGAAPGTGVPITPLATGRIRIVGALEIKNNSDSNERVDVTLSALSDVSTINLAFPFLLSNSIGVGAIEVVPLVAETQASEALVVGTLYNFFVTITSTNDTDVELVALNSTIELQEVPVPTG